ncbi:hypothetical protein M405DRAFT_816234 [Rhizopogon salebrosus TDB-379]|nr:hypothetical protein M405DRAFT_816234 [Rhizopogon salebrosus TDB-379]
MSKKVSKIVCKFPVLNETPFTKLVSPDGHWTSDAISLIGGNGLKRNSFTGRRLRFDGRTGREWPRGTTI